MSWMQLSGEVNHLLYVGFNQNYQCFACGTQAGFIVYSVDPFTEILRKDFEDSGIGIVEMLFRSKTFALVGGGSKPKWPPTKVVIWDEERNECTEQMSFESNVKAVKLRKDRLVVVLEQKICVYGFPDLILYDSFDTRTNPKGICCLSSNPDHSVLVCPSLKKGNVRVELYHQKRVNEVAAHEGALWICALSMDGKLLATCSNKGTLIRIWDTATGVKIQELRRGTDTAVIQSMVFSPKTSSYLAITSHKGTIHLFRIIHDGKSEDTTLVSDESIISSMSGTKETTQEEKKEEDAADSDHAVAGLTSAISDYFGSQWSFAQFRRLPSHSQTLLAFSADERCLIAVCGLGIFFKIPFKEDQTGELKAADRVEFASRSLSAKESTSLVRIPSILPFPLNLALGSS